MAESAINPDEVTPGDPASPVGLCTLWTRQDRILRGVPPELYAVCGNLYSLWGISVLLRGVLARPTLRYLVVCGVDYADTGRALVALVADGLAADGTLPGTTARLADDLDAAVLGRFRAQVSVVDLRGCTDAARVAAAIRALPPPSLGAAPASRLVAAGWTPPPLTAPGHALLGTVPTRTSAEDAAPAPPSSPRAALPTPEGDAAAPSGPPGSRGDPAQATPPLPQPGGEPAGSPLANARGRMTAWSALPAAGGFQPDPLGNFLVAVGGGQLVAAHATTTGGPTGARFTGRTATEVYDAILAAGLVSQLDHAAYLGAELARAEIALRLGISYRQDRPLALPAR